jgi:parallel beta-helix repeat protein
MAPRVLTSSASITEQLSMSVDGGQAALVVAADGITLDFAGGTLTSGIEEPERRQGIGVLLEGRRDVALRNLRVSGYHQNLVLRGCRNVRIEGGDFSESHAGLLHSGEAYDERDWLDINVNLIAFNDGSHSPHNAFESTFSARNRFFGNLASNSRYGFWCGYSHHNKLIGNGIEGDECLARIEKAGELVFAGIWMGAAEEAAIRARRDLRETGPEALQILSLAATPLPPPVLPVTARPADPEAVAETGFQWYAGRKGLVGSAEV